MSSESPSAETPLSILTWNMQGAGTSDLKKGKLRIAMEDRTLSAICLQECGTLHDWRDVVNDYGWDMHHTPWGTNTRCSLAILYRIGEKHVSPGESELDGYEGKRPMLWVTIRGRRIFTIHAPAGGHKGTIAFDVGAVTKASESFIPWIVVGDFNVSPGVLQPHLPAGELARNGLPTQLGGRELDYGVVSGGSCKVHHPTIGPSTYFTGGISVSDHAPVQIEWTVSAPAPSRCVVM